MEKDREILLVPPPPLLNGKIFQRDNSQRSLEITEPMRALKERFAKLGYNLITIDQSEDIKKAHAVIFIELPKKNNAYYQFCKKNRMNERMYFVVGEPPAVRPDDHDPSLHSEFKGVLTFNSELVDNRKYFRIDYTLPIRLGEKVKISRFPFSSKKLLSLVSSNKFSAHPCELYSERITAIRFMERFHSSDFDLFGNGWDKPMIHARWASALKINGAIWRFWPKGLQVRTFASWRGPIPDKAKTMPRYRFTIAYENCVTPGFISEKPLEAMLFGCVPIYLGDPGVLDRIPKGCLIDKRDFRSYDDLYERISSMEEKEHEEFLDSIESFLNSPKVRPFTIDAFVDSFMALLGI